MSDKRISRMTFCLMYGFLPRFCSVWSINLFFGIVTKNSEVLIKKFCGIYVGHMFICMYILTVVVGFLHIV